MPVALPVVAIVGRPNVGKSSLLNWLVGRRISIVDPTAGVTRDRVAVPVEIDGHWVELTDTGGIGIVDADNLAEDVERQIRFAIDQADVILFLVDARAGVVALDEEVSKRLRGLGKPVVLVANKCDADSLEPLASDFYRLGHGAVVAVSAEQRRGQKELFDRIVPLLPADKGEAPRDPVMKLAIVGRRNTGKSTFINSLAEAERVIVSEVPGTTRDSVDVRFECDGQTFVAIDTAGVRKKKSLANDIEFYSLNRAQRSIRRADVVLLFLDPRVKISKVDKQLAEFVLEEHRPVIFVANKWDLAKDDMATGAYAEYLHKIFPMLDYVPVSFITAKAGKNVRKVLNLAQQLFKQASARVGTGDLNRVVRQALEGAPPPTRYNRRAKVFYATQATANPPTVVLFTNGPELFDDTYRRYLEKYFRDRLPFSEVPIKLQLRAKKRPGDGPAIDAEAPEVEVAKAPAKPGKAKPGKAKRREPGSAGPGLWDV
jgi:GTPase